MIKKRLTFTLICLFFFCLSIGCGRKPKATPLFPETLPNLHLIKLIKGKEAKKEVNRLHGKEIPVKDAWVAYYRGAFFEGNWNEATIWISEAFSLEEASKQTKIMMEKIIHNPRSPFYNVKVITTPQGKMYIFWGMGNEHAVFQKQTMVYWISATPEVFDGVLAYYK
ncbi:MAG: hypothetical protein LWW94_05115 [Candidatus Desulfofervidaceae bacterium]|nr:hypothetical protein [Candidatus Desulfofervidaceae bacterium]